MALETYPGFQAGVTADNHRHYTNNLKHAGRPGIFDEDSLEVTESDTPAMSVEIKTGSCVVRNQFSGGQGDYIATNYAEFDVSLSASDPTNGRLDAVVVRIRDSFYSGATDAADVFVVEGTPSGSPAVDTGSFPDTCFCLAVVTVSAADTSITDGEITDERLLDTYTTQTGQDNGTTVSPFTGGRILCDSTDIPLLYLTTGIERYDRDNGEVYRYDGSSWAFVSRDSDGAWIDYNPSLTNWTASSTTGTMYKTEGDLVHYRFHAVLASVSGSFLYVSLPFTAHSDVRNKFTGEQVILDDIGAGLWGGVVKIESGGTLVTMWGVGSTSAINQPWSNTVPVTSAVGDTFDFCVTYKRA